MANPDQARNKEGKWTKAGNAAATAAGVPDEVTLNHFRKLAYEWVGGVNYESKEAAYYMATHDKALHDYLIAEAFGSNPPSMVEIYRTGEIDLGGIISFFTSRGQAVSYGHGIEPRSFFVPLQYLVPTGAGSGEVWISGERLEDYYG